MATVADATGGLAIARPWAFVFEQVPSSCPLPPQKCHELLFEMLCGWSPFYAEDTQEMYRNICFGKIKFPKGVISNNGKQFVKRVRKVSSIASLVRISYYDSY